MLDKYKDRLRYFCLDLEEFCKGNDIDYIGISNNLPLEEVLLKSLRGENLII